MSTEMKIIIDCCKKIEATVFNGRFERRDLETLKKWCETLIKITDKTLLKAAPVQQTTTPGQNGSQADNGSAAASPVA
jgi:hypothetical protein